MVSEENLRLLEGCPIGVLDVVMEGLENIDLWTGHHVDVGPNRDALKRQFVETKREEYLTKVIFELFQADQLRESQAMNGGEV